MTIRFTSVFMDGADLLLSARAVQIGCKKGNKMKKFSIGAVALAATIAVSAPALAKHQSHHHKGHEKAHAAHQQADKGSASTEDLNARSLQQAQTPVPATAPSAAPNAVPTAPTAPGAMPAMPNAPTTTVPTTPGAAPSVPMNTPSSTLPANAPQPPTTNQ